MRALASRDVIGQAKGILMHRDNLIGLQAFATLIHASKDTNIKLVDVARWIVSEHESGVTGGT
jgi:AmiR/NasT family two-component response regulator